MRFIDQAADQYDVVVVGSGFGSTFFLHQLLGHLPETARILVLERGQCHSHAEQIEMGAQSAIDQTTTYERRGHPDKTWNFTVAFGGGSNCWWANACRQHPSDFNLKSTYGIGRDWPLNYDDLEPYYQIVEDIMQISGPDENAPWLRKGPYPMPPHVMPRPDQILAQHNPLHHFVISTARPPIDTATRPKCCINGVCHLCPIDSKFTIQNSFQSPFDDPRVEILLGAEVRRLDVAGVVAKGVVYRFGGQDKTVSGDLIALGANAIFNPVILKKSGLDHPELGRNLHEQYSMFGELFLDGVDHFQGSTSVNGLNYSMYDRPTRGEEASILVETWNLGPLRSERGRWRQVMPFGFKIEDLPQEQNRVTVGDADDDRPEVHFEDYSSYTLATAAKAKEIAEKIFKSLPVEKITFRPEPLSTSSHLHGTTIMGTDPSDSILDADQIHHSVRNLVVLGGGGFPSGSQSNPTVTICAMAMKAADKIGRSGHRSL